MNTEIFSRPLPMLHGVAIVLLATSVAYAESPEMIRRSLSVIRDPQIQVRVSAAAISAAFTRHRRYEAPVQDTILGARVTGRGFHDVKVSPRLLPDEDELRFVLDLNTLVESQTVSRKNAATISSRGITQIVGEKLITFDGQRFAMRPTNANATTQSEMVGFSWGRLIGARIALQEARDSKRKAEKVSASHAASRAKEEMDREIDSQLDALAGKMRTAIGPIATGKIPWQYHLATSHDAITLNARLADEAEIVAANEKSATERVLHDFELRFDPAVAVAFANRWLAGRSVQEEDWNNEFGTVLTQGRDALSIATQGKQWTVNFHDDEPLAIDLGEDGLIRISIRIKGFTVGAVEYPGMAIHGKYRLASTPPSELNRFPQFDLVPEGRVEVLPLQASGGGRVGIRQQVFRSMVRERFTPILSQPVSLTDLLDHASIEQLCDTLQLASPDIEINSGELVLWADRATTSLE